MKRLTLMAVMLALCATCVAAETRFVMGEGLTFVELSSAELAALFTPAYAAEKKNPEQQNLLPKEMRAALDAQKKAKKPDPAAAAKERQARARLAMDFRRVADKLTADEVKAVRAIVAKHAAKPAKPAVKPAKKK